MMTAWCADGRYNEDVHVDLGEPVAPLGLGEAGAIEQLELFEDGRLARLARAEHKQLDDRLLLRLLFLKLLLQNL